MLLVRCELSRCGSGSLTMMDRQELSAEEDEAERKKGETRLKRRSCCKNSVSRVAFPRPLPSAQCPAARKRTPGMWDLRSARVDQQKSQDTMLPTISKANPETEDTSGDNWTGTKRIEGVEEAKHGNINRRRPESGSSVREKGEGRNGGGKREGGKTQKQTMDHDVRQASDPLSTLSTASCTR